jgi:hypothetical protein
VTQLRQALPRKCTPPGLLQNGWLSCLEADRDADLISTLADPHLLLLNCRSKPSGLCLRPATPRLPSHLRLHSWLSKPHRSCLLLSRRTCRAPSVGPQHHRQPLHSTPSSQSRERHAKRQPRLSWTLSSTGQSQSTSHWCLAQSHRLSRPPTAFRTEQTATFQAAGQSMPS